MSDDTQVCESKFFGGAESGIQDIVIAQERERARLRVTLTTGIVLLYESVLSSAASAHWVLNSYAYAMSASLSGEGGTLVTASRAETPLFQNVLVELFVF